MKPTRVDPSTSDDRREVTVPTTVKRRVGCEVATRTDWPRCHPCDAKVCASTTTSAGDEGSRPASSTNGRRFGTGPTEIPLAVDELPPISVPSAPTSWAYPSTSPWDWATPGTPRTVASTLSGTGTNPARPGKLEEERCPCTATETWP